MNASKSIIKFYGLYITVLFFSSNILSVVQTGGDPEKRKKHFVEQSESAKEPYIVPSEKEIIDNIGETKKLKKATLPIKVKEVKESPFSYDFSGYVRLDSFYDSRQNIDYWKGLDYSYPSAAKYDPNDEDINDQSTFSMAPFAKVGVKITGPEVWNAKSSVVLKSDVPGKHRFEKVPGEILFDVFGNFRFQHGYFNLEWEKTQLLGGVYYSPVVLLELCADTVSIEAGEFFDPFNYSGMLRVRHLSEPMEFVFAVHKLFWYEIMRHSLAPSLYGQVNVHVKDHLFCAGVNMDVVQPRLETDEGYKEDESIPHFLAFIGMVLKRDNLTWKNRLTYAENPFFYTLIGGYAPCSKNSDTDYRHYTKLRSINFWSDFSHATNKRELGVFFGWAKNLGSRNEIVDVSDVVGEATDMAYSFRVQPRIRFFRGPVTIGFEISHSRAAYGTTNECGRVTDYTECTKVSNTRVISSIVYSF